MSQPTCRFLVSLLNEGMPQIARSRVPTCSRPSRGVLAVLLGARCARPYPPFCSSSPSSFAIDGPSSLVTLLSHGAIRRGPESAALPGFPARTVLSAGFERDDARMRYP